MKIIIKNNNNLYNKSTDIYHTEGLKIAKKLHLIAISNKDCIGLAHNQIGGNNSVFVAKINNKWRYFINPKIISTSSKSHNLVESCMSFPNKYNNVKRHLKIELQHQIKARNDNNGNAFINEKFEGMNAIIIQHEIDHLNGKTIFCNK